jgi:O-succinylbenzoate synthase
MTATSLREHRLRVGKRDVLLVEGPAGWGECSPLPGYPCEPERALAAAVEAARDGWPPAVRDEVPVSALVDDGRVDAGALDSAPAVKVKVGRRRIEDDVERVRVVREIVGPAVAVRIDANGAWDVDAAVDAITRLAPFDLELVEQPVVSIDDMATVRRRVDVPLAADECLRSVDDARRLRSLDAADVIVLKVQPLGGVRRALEVAEAARLPAVVTSMYETSVGIAAGVALACALPELPYACGLATLDLIGGDVTREPLRPVRWRLRPSRVVPDAGLLARYSVMS